MSTTSIETYPVNHERSVAEQTAEQFTEIMEHYVHDPDLHELIAALAEDRGIEIPDLSDPDLDEATFMDAAQKALDVRKGKGRDEIAGSAFSSRAQEALGTVKHKFNMDIDTEPTIHDVDAAFVLGSSGKTPRARLDYLLDLMEVGKLSTDMIVMIGSERPVNMKPNANGLTEIDRAESAGYDSSGNMAKTEFDIMRNTAAAALSIEDDDWEMITGYDPSVPEHHHYQNQYRIAHAEKNGKQVMVISAPMIGEERFYPDGNRRPRSNTSDGYRMAAQMMRDHAEPGQEFTTVSVTDAIFTPFQEADAKAVLAKDFSIENETVGYTRKRAGLPEWPGGDALYGQEVLSALRQTRAARDYLADS